MIQEFEIRVAMEHYKDYAEAMQEAEWEIEELQTRMEHAGSSVAKMPENPIDSGKLKVANMDRMRALVGDRDRHQHSVKLAESFIAWCIDTPRHKDKSFIIDRYREGRTIFWMATTYNIDRSMVFKRTDYLIKKYSIRLKLATSLPDIRDSM